MTSLKALRNRLSEVYTYLDQVVSGKMPVNHNILYLLQDVFNLLPGLHTTDTQQSIVKKTNDTYLAMYLGSVIRCIISLHDLINNKIELRENEAKLSEKVKKEGEKKEEKEGEKEAQKTSTQEKK